MYHSLEKSELSALFHNAEYDLYAYKNKNKRELFYHLINIDEYTDVLPTAEKIVISTLEKTKIQDFLPYTEKQKLSTYLHKYREKKRTSTNDSLSEDAVKFILQQQAPCALIDGAWLGNSGSIVYCHTELSALLFQIYSYKLGNFQREKNHFYLYQDVLQAISVSVPEIQSFSFVTQPHIIDSSFSLAVYYLSIAQFPRKFLPEIIGITLAHCFAGFDQFYLPQEYRKQLYFQRLPFYQMHNDNDNIIQKLICYLCEHDEIGLDDWKRMWNGFYSIASITNLWKQQMRKHISEEDSSPRDKVIAMISQKAPYSRGHHRETLIGEKTLPEWFDSEEINVSDFLDALAESHFIDRENPEKSLLLTNLISFGGPMFRVFTEDEIETIKKWIASLPQKQNHTQLVICPFRQKKKTSTKQPKKKNHPKLKNIRDLFYHLVNIDIYPESKQSAWLYTKKFLKKTQRYMPFFPKKYRLFPYEHNAFSDRIHTIYESQMNAYKEFTAPPLFSRELYSDWFMYQLAPLVLVDGCWLQNIARPGCAHSQVATYLFNTFSDEIGNGYTEWNHANVYRKLLQNENANLPPFNSKEFAHHSKIENAAFDLPVLQLSISQFPKTYQPEIIGLNLAIEMGGLGWEYMTLVDELTYWNIDPYIVSLHISIDNMATGHTAWAMESVQIYLDKILSIHGQKEVQQQWKRIWTGFLSYKVSRFRLIRNLAQQYAKDIVYKTLNIRKKM